MKMLDYAQWLQRAINFMNGLWRLPGAVDYAATGRDGPGVMNVELAVAPPLSEPEVRELARSCRLPIPAALRRFWTEASRNCFCSYWWHTPKEFHHQVAIALPGWRGPERPIISGGPEFSRVG